MIPPRRSFLTGLVSLIASPAIVRAGSLMPVKATDQNFGYCHLLLDGTGDYATVINDDFHLGNGDWTIDFIVSRGKCVWTRNFEPPQLRA